MQNHISILKNFQNTYYQLNLKNFYLSLISSYQEGAKLAIVFQGSDILRIWQELCHQFDFDTDNFKYYLEFKDYVQSDQDFDQVIVIQRFIQNQTEDYKLPSLLENIQMNHLQQMIRSDEEFYPIITEPGRIERKLDRQSKKQSRLSSILTKKRKPQSYEIFTAGSLSRCKITNFSQLSLEPIRSQKFMNDYVARLVELLKIIEEYHDVNYVGINSFEKNLTHNMFDFFHQKFQASSKKVQIFKYGFAEFLYELTISSSHSGIFINFCNQNEILFTRIDLASKGSSR